MFYKENQISNELNCKLCKNRLEKPKILPCCGQTICLECTSLIEIKEETNEFKCQLCAKIYLKPNDGFLTNFALLNLLSIQPINDESIEKLESNLNIINKKIKEIKLASNNNGADFIQEYCIDLRTDVQLATELAIIQLNDFNDNFIRKINNYEKECISNLKEKQNDNDTFLNELIKFSQNASDLLLSNNKRIDYLTLIMKTNEKAQEFINNAEIQKLKLENLIFNGKKLIFERNETKLKDLQIGSFLCENLTTTHQNNISAILTNEQMKQLMILINFSQDVKWKLIYRASVHGFGSVNFHSKCDGIRSTLTIIKSNDLNVFGGFCFAEWSSKNSYQTDQNGKIYYLNFCYFLYLK